MSGGAEIALAPAEPATLPVGPAAWTVVRGQVEVYLTSPERRRLVVVIGAGEQAFGLPPGSGAGISLLAPDGALLRPAAPGDDVRASAARWLGADLPDGDNAPEVVVAHHLLTLEDRYRESDAARDAADLARLGESLAREVGTDGGDGLQTALATVAVALGLAAPRPPAASDAGRSATAIPQLARAAGFRARRITLPAAWPRTDLGPLLVRERANGRVHALVWQAQGYMMGERRVDAALAGEFEGSAHVAFAPLPPRVVDLFGLGRDLLGGVKGELGWIAAAGLAIALTGLAVPLVTAWLFEDVVPDGRGGLLVAAGIALGAAAVVQAILAAARMLAQARIEGLSGVRLAAGLSDRLLRLPARFFKTMPAGDLGQRIQAVETMRSLVVGILLSSGVMALFSLVYLALLMAYDAPLALAALGVAIVYLAALFASRFYQLAPLREAAALDGRLAGITYETLEGIAKLRTAAAEHRAMTRWRTLYEREQAALVRSDRITNRFDCFADLWQVLALTLLFAVAASLREAVPPGRFIGFLAGYTIFQSAFLAFCDALLRLMATQPLAERARTILAAEPETGTGSADPGRLTGLIEVSAVSFGYRPDDPPLLANLSFTLRPGEHFAIVGGSGSGKSTILRLLLGFETARTGTIFYDGQDYATLDPARVRQQIGVVLQSSQLFAGTILENIRGANDLTLTQCLDAARLAGLGRDLDEFPMGIHTPVTEGAGTLSGGQRQRVLIARAIAGDPRILFFDEATSALDNVTQALVTRTIDRMDVARITIAHRLSTVRNATRIGVLADGRLAETGTFDELMARNRRFAELARRQLVGD